MLRGRLARLPYAKALLLRVAAFALPLLFFPVVVQALAAHVLGCARIGSACGSLGVVVFYYGKPLLYAGLVLALVPLVVRRVRDLGLPGGAGLLLPALLACYWHVDVLIRGGPAFAEPAPWTLAMPLVAAAGLLALCLLPSASHRHTVSAGAAPGAEHATQ